MADAHDAIAVSAVPPGAVVECEVADRTLVIANVDGALFAIDSECTHMVASLVDGVLDPRCFTIECPLHGSRFDLRTGEPLERPARRPVRTYPVDVVDGMIRVVVDE